MTLSRRKKSIILAGCGLCLASMLGYRLLLCRTPVAVVMIKEDEIQGKVHGPGTVQSRVPVSVSAKIIGILEKLYVDQGDLVMRGQLLAELDVQELKSRVEASRAALKAAQDQAASELRVAEANLSYTQIAASMDGLITVRTAEVGDTVIPGT